MQPLDILLCIPLGFALYVGWRRGIMVEIVNTIGLVVAVVAGFMLMDIVLNLLNPILGKQTWLPVLAFLLTVGAIFYAVLTLAKISKDMVRKTLFGQLDQALGAALSLWKMALSISFFIWVMGVLDIRIPKRHTQDTFIYPALSHVGPLTAKGVYFILPFLAKVPGWLEETLSPTSENPTVNT